MSPLIILMNALRITDTNVASRGRSAALFRTSFDPVTFDVRTPENDSSHQDSKNVLKSRS